MFHEIKYFTNKSAKPIAQVKTQLVDSQLVAKCQLALKKRLNNLQLFGVPDFFSPSENIPKGQTALGLVFKPGLNHAKM